MYLWHKTIKCSCNSPEHLIALDYDQDMGLMIAIQANSWMGFWQRLKFAVKYVFTATLGTHFWDATMIETEDIVVFEEWLAQAKEKGNGSFRK